MVEPTSLDLILLTQNSDATLFSMPCQTAMTNSPVQPPPEFSAYQMNNPGNIFVSWRKLEINCNPKCKWDSLSSSIRRHSFCQFVLYISQIGIALHGSLPPLFWKNRLTQKNRSTFFQTACSAIPLASHRYWVDLLRFQRESSQKRTYSRSNQNRGLHRCRWWQSDGRANCPQPQTAKKPAQKAEVENQLITNGCQWNEMFKRINGEGQCPNQMHQNIPGCAMPQRHWQFTKTWTGKMSHKRFCIAKLFGRLISALSMYMVRHASNLVRPPTWVQKIEINTKH